MQDLMVWLLAGALPAAAVLTHSGWFRPLVPAVVNTTPVQSQPTRSD